MNNDLLFLVLAVVILVVFVIVVYYWFRTANKEYVVDDSIKGFYKTAGLNQRCVSGTKQTEYNLLPSYYEPQVCGINQTCVYGDTGGIYGFCKSVEGGYCNTVYDCAPSDSGNIYCIGGICTGSTGGVLYSACSNTVIGACSVSSNLICSQGTCLYENGIECNNSNQCASGFCAPSVPNGLTGICIGQYAPGQQCNANFCQTGFECDFSQGNYGFCQPVSKNQNLGGVIPIQTGSIGALCSIPNGSTPTVPCNNGLICNFNAYTNSSSVYPGITGFGLCDTPLLQTGMNCSSSGGACIPPAVCSSYESNISFCQAPRDDGGTGMPNINYCGYGSTYECGTGYSCIGTECLPSLDYLCNSGITGICQSSTCSGNKLGIFTPIRNGGTGIGNFGTWSYVDLPSVESPPNQNSYLSTYQYMSVSGSQPVINTRLIYFQGFNFLSGLPYFNLADYSDLQNFSFVSVGITNFPSNYTILGIKFTSNGNIGLYTLSDNPDIRHIYYFNYSSLTPIGPNYEIDFTSNVYDVEINQTTIPVSFTITDWDIDDKYNVSNTGVPALAISGTDLFNTNLGIIYYNYMNEPVNDYTSFDNQIVNGTKWVRFIYNYQSSPDIGSFIFGGIFNNVPSIVLPNKSGGFTNTILPFSEATCNGVASFFNYTNNFDNLELFYSSNRGFNYYNAIFNNSTMDYNNDITVNYNYKDVQIQGYTPSYNISNYIHTLSYGNLDRTMFALVEICE